MAAGAGYYDAQGVWKYGETDNIGTLFSDFMNLSPTSISTQFAADRSRLTTLETAVNNPTIYVAANAAARDAKWGVPANASQQLALQNKGATTIRLDLGIEERYLGAYNASTNPGGVKTAGWYPLPGTAVLHGTASRSLATGTTYSVGASGFSLTETVDVLSWHDASTNPDRVTPNREGLYRVSYYASLSGSGVNGRQATVLKNGTAIFYGGAANSNYGAVSNVIGLTYMNGSTDYFTFTVTQDSGVSMTATVNLSVEYIRPTIV